MELKHGVTNKKTDLLEATIGGFGKWQCKIAVCMALLKFPIAWFQLGIIFVAPPTQHWCRQPEDFRAMSHQQWIDMVTPLGNETNFHESVPHCSMRNIELPLSNTLVPCKWGYEFNRTIIHSNIITEWNLVCGKESLVAVTQMVLMLGVLIGNALFGVLADKHGRKKTLIACIFLQSLCGMMSAWAPWFEFFLLFRFLMALANGGTMIVSFIMCMEVVGGTWRTIVSLLYQIPFSIGNAVMAGLAYCYRDWRELQLFLSLISVVFMMYIWIIPESPRWLLVTGKRKEAARILQKAAAYNGLEVAKIREGFLIQPILSTDEKPKFRSIFQTKQLRSRTLLLCINWLLSGLTFFGFSQYVGQIGSNIYMTVSIAGIIGIPGTLACIYIIKSIGRRWAISCSAIFTASCFFGILLVPTDRYLHDWPKVVFAAFGIVGLSISTPALYLLTGELYPTTLRNIGVGWTVMFCRVGSMISPFIISLHTWLPLTIFGVLSISHGLLILLLPESSGVLPETINDIEMSEISNNNNDGSYKQVRKVGGEEHCHL